MDVILNMQLGLALLVFFNSAQMNGTGPAKAIYPREKNLIGGMGCPATPRQISATLQLWWWLI